MENLNTAQQNQEYIPMDMFDPSDIRWQHQLYYDIYNNKEQYPVGTHTLVLSGAYGSAKTSMAIKLMWEFLIQNAGTYGCLCRRTKTDIEMSNLQTFLQMAPSNWVEGEDFIYNKSKGIVKLINGSEVHLLYWHTGKYTKFKSRSYQFFHIEEATESGDIKFWTAATSRTGRNKHIEMTYVVLTTNPDEPEHPIYSEIMSKAGWIDGERAKEGESDYLDPYIHVYYSVTADNPHINPTYIENLKRTRTSRELLRDLYGQWISLHGAGIYYEYTDDMYIRKDYVVDVKHPIIITCDFNIADGKPMSTVFGQFINDHFHWFNELIIHDCSTAQMWEAIGEHDDRLLDYPTEYIITGDATGYSKDSTSSWSDYYIIKKYLNNYISKATNNHINYRMGVRKTNNPAIKKRHSLVNSYLRNSLGQKRTSVYAKCVMLNKGLKLSRLKNANTYLEDDSKEWQHCSTAIGYAEWWLTRGQCHSENVNFE